VLAERSQPECGEPREVGRKAVVEGSEPPSEGVSYGEGAAVVVDAEVVDEGKNLAGAFELPAESV